MDFTRTSSQNAKSCSNYYCYLNCNAFFLKLLSDSIALKAVCGVGQDCDGTRDGSPPKEGAGLKHCCSAIFII